jgi:hypothetical protein
MVVIDVSELYEQQAKLSDYQKYLKKVLSMDLEGKDVIITGQGPIWLYLKIAHDLHGKVRSLTYNSPVTGNVKIFDHNPF